MGEHDVRRSSQPGVRRARLPPQNAVVDQTTHTPERSAVSEAQLGIAGRTYRILRTNEFDAKDTPTPVVLFGARLAPFGDEFFGEARKAAKLALADAPVENLADVGALIESLASKSAMIRHRPKITTDQDSGRVAEENRNVRLRAFLYAASREADNDFHLIIGDDPNSEPPVYLTSEISGLPPADSDSFAALKSARDAYKTFFGDNLPGASYDFYDPPIPIEIEGSLFFDMSHARGRSPGPPSLHPDMPTIWEIHPVSKIVFEPQ
jgi:hypothetical protein